MSSPLMSDPLLDEIVKALTKELVERGVDSLSEKSKKYLNILRKKFAGNAKAANYLEDFVRDPKTFESVLQKEIVSAAKNDTKFVDALLTGNDSGYLPYVQTPHGNITTSHAEPGGISSAIGGNSYGPVKVGPGHQIVNSQVSVFGIPVAAIGLLGSVAIMFGYFGMPWITVLFSLTGFEMTNQFTSPPVYSSQPVNPINYVFWLIPVAGLIAALVSLAELAAKGEGGKDKWFLSLVVCAAAIFPYYYLFSSLSGGLSEMGLRGLSSNVIASGFWISLTGTIIGIVVSLWVMIAPANKSF